MSSEALLKAATGYDVCTRSGVVFTPGATPLTVRFDAYSVQGGGLGIPAGVHQELSVRRSTGDAIWTTGRIWVETFDHGEYLDRVALVPFGDALLLGYRISRCAAQCGGGVILALVRIDDRGGREILRVEGDRGLAFDTDDANLYVWWNVWRQTDGGCCPSAMEVRRYARTSEGYSLRTRMVRPRVEGLSAIAYLGDGVVHQSERYGVRVTHPARCAAVTQDAGTVTFGDTFVLTTSSPLGSLADLVKERSRGWTVTSSDNVTVDGRTAVSISYRTSSASLGRAVFIARRSTAYAFTFDANRARCEDATAAAVDFERSALTVSFPDPAVMGVTGLSECEAISGPTASGSASRWTLDCGAARLAFFRPLLVAQAWQECPAPTDALAGSVAVFAKDDLRIKLAEAIVGPVPFVNVDQTRRTDGRCAF